MAEIARLSQPFLNSCCIGPEAGRKRFVNILDRFEQSFERLVEGSVGRIFRSPIQPAEIGRKLERAMMEKHVVSVGSTLVPNDFNVVMHPQDMLLFADFVPALCRQMESWLADVANQRGYSMVDRVRVQIAGDERLSRRAINVTAAIMDHHESRHDQDHWQRTELFRVVRATTGIIPVRLEVVSGPQSGEEVVIRKPATTIGRAVDNDIVLTSNDVSRYHARIERAGENLRIVDLGSTNGIKVNGRGVHAEQLRIGDAVTLGTTTLRVSGTNSADR
jgi:hypothetical protein